jgi:hypothetical protein
MSPHHVHSRVGKPEDHSRSRCNTDHSFDRFSTHHWHTKGNFHLMGLFLRIIYLMTGQTLTVKIRTQWMGTWNANVVEKILRIRTEKWYLLLQLTMGIKTEIHHNSSPSPSRSTYSKISLNVSKPLSFLSSSITTKR